MFATQHNVSTARVTAFIAIGANCVGSIIATPAVGSWAAKGDELGYFAFGGSTIAMLFPPASVLFDDDLVFASSRGVETQVPLGNPIGQWLV